MQRFDILRYYASITQLKLLFSHFYLNLIYSKKGMNGLNFVCFTKLRGIMATFDT